MAGEEVPFVLTWYPSHEPVPARGRRRSPRRRTRRRWWRGVVVAARTSNGPHREPRPAQPDHAEGAHVRADRRHRRGADDLAARARSAASATGTTASAGCATRRSTLQALMHAGYLDEARAWRDWLLRAVAGRAGGDADHVRPGGRAAADRARARLAARATRARARCGSATRPPTSSSSTSTAS